MLRPPIELHWTRDVARWSDVALENAALQAHPFGVERTAVPSALVAGLVRSSRVAGSTCDAPVVVAPGKFGAVRPRLGSQHLMPFWTVAVPESMAPPQGW
jgi:hypothetical protein